MIRVVLIIVFVVYNESKVIILIYCLMRNKGDFYLNDFLIRMFIRIIYK